MSSSPGCSIIYPRRADDDSLCYAGVATAPVATDDEPFRRRARLAWAALIKRVYEVDPLLCPFCGGEMKVRLDDLRSRGDADHRIRARPARETNRVD